ncbi:hypothetical protein ABZ517_16550 [Streptomyces scabiei]|uniref:hypothetical protein n=1 Tax=Streptomyces scabiei TaxID=1930 RepID=UPI0033E38CE8
MALKDVDLKYQQGVLTTSKSLAVGGTLSVGGVDYTSVQPADLGLKAWSYDPAAASNSQAVTSGIVYLSGIYVRKAMTVSTLVYAQMTAGTSPTAGANWIGLYNSAGTKLADAALDSVLTSVGIKQVAISSQSLTPGLYWVALVQNATSPQFACTSGSGTGQGFVSLGLTSGATSRYAANGTGATTLASTITPASNTTTNAKYFWSALN